MGKNGNSGKSYFLGLQNHCGWWLQPWSCRTLAPWKESSDKPRQSIKNHFAGKGLNSQSYGFSSSHVQMWELNHKELWALKNWCFHIVRLEKTLESPLNSKEIKPVYPIEINPEYSLGWQMLKLKLQYFGHLMWRADSLEMTLMLGKVEGRRLKTEDEIVR